MEGRRKCVASCKMRRCASLSNGHQQHHGIPQHHGTTFVEMFINHAVRKHVSCTASWYRALLAIKKEFPSQNERTSVIVYDITVPSFFLLFMHGFAIDSSMGVAFPA